MPIFISVTSIYSRNANGSGTSAILAGRMIILGQRSVDRSHLPVGVPRSDTHLVFSTSVRTCFGGASSRPRLDALYTWAFSCHRDVGGIVLRYVCTFNRRATGLENVPIIIIIMVRIRSQRYLCLSKTCLDVKIVEERILGD